MRTPLEVRHLRGLDRPVSALGAGCWTIGGPTINRGTPIGWDRIDADRAIAGLRRAYELGVRLFDTADVYGLGRSERLLGRLLAEVPRDEVVITSKVGYLTGSAAHPYERGQMRRQLRRTLANLGTDHLDAYHLHSADFGPADDYLRPAIDQMRAFVEENRVRAIGIRAPHAFAVEWADGPICDQRARGAARFLRLFNEIRPDVITVRHNLLSPTYGPDETDAFDFARLNGVGVIIKQALGQGLLLGTHRPDLPRSYGPGDHRRADPLFTPETLKLIHTGLTPIRARFGSTVTDLSRVALRYALARDTTAPVLVGFRDDAQITTDIACLGAPLSEGEMTWLHHSLAELRNSLTRRNRENTPSTTEDS